MAKRNHDSDIAFVEALAQLLREHDLTELEVVREYGSDDTLNIRVARQAEARQIVQNVAAAPAAAATSEEPADVSSNEAACER